MEETYIFKPKKILVRYGIMYLLILLVFLAVTCIIWPGGKLEYRLILLLVDFFMMIWAADKLSKLNKNVLTIRGDRFHLQICGMRWPMPGEKLKYRPGVAELEFSVADIETVSYTADQRKQSFYCYNGRKRGVSEEEIFFTLKDGKKCPFCGAFYTKRQLRELFDIIKKCSGAKLTGRLGIDFRS